MVELQGRYMSVIATDTATTTGLFDEDLLDAPTPMGDGGSPTRLTPIRAVRVEPVRRLAVHAASAHDVADSRCPSKSRVVCPEGGRRVQRKPAEPIADGGLRAREPSRNLTLREAQLDQRFEGFTFHLYMIGPPRQARVTTR